MVMSTDGCHSLVVGADQCLDGSAMPLDVGEARPWGPKWGTCTGYGGDSLKGAGHEGQPNQAGWWFRPVRRPALARRGGPQGRVLWRRGFPAQSSQRGAVWREAVGRAGAPEGGANRLSEAFRSLSLQAPGRRFGCRAAATWDESKWLGDLEEPIIPRFLTPD
jgi:hypothetical protein